MTQKMIQLVDFQIRSPQGVALGRPLTADFEAGKVHVVSGPNGSGKTSLLRSLVPLLPGDSIFISQHPRVQDFPPLRVSELTRFAGALNGLSSESLHVLFDPQGRDRHWVSQGLDRVSGGQLQRAILAMALRSSAPVLLLDEPENHLDQASRSELPKLFEAFVALPGRMIIWVTHLEAARNWPVARSLELHISGGSSD